MNEAKLKIKFMYEHSEKYTKSDDSNNILHLEFIEKQLTNIFIITLVTLDIALIGVALSCGKIHGG